ncbi:MAG: Rrf2 family transcriptional regulator [Eubacteriales bacterium]|nr:Rrf2 family transcriptional regulator [Eubacteriales bacterium]MDD3110304.1 Rrf2 family transcriptional regulator [Eubacteriales bacterium]MDD3571354.1 Rrf2 family transcriptional regulator [Eubacteriales bacterium]MDD4133947.1 Rrf2 family transcriptional regulator [Eubacteriales bacterium]NLO14308.1 Rrf2 family transcriptional regulator [Clostridiales bacterium]
MKLTAKSHYAMLAMLHLAQHLNKGPQTLSRIIKAGQPREYTEQLLGALRRSGLIVSVRGNKGGYLLAKNPGDITVAQIIESVEGPLTLSHCVLDAGACENSCGCALKGTWEYLTRGIEEVMNTVTLKDMLVNPSLITSTEKVTH